MRHCLPSRLHNRGQVTHAVFHKDSRFYMPSGLISQTVVLYLQRTLWSTMFFLIDNKIMKYRNYYCTPKFSEKEASYYGKVEGVPEINMIESGSLEDFERMFHDAVDDYLDGRRKHFPIGLVVSVLLLFVILFVAAAVTCPKKNQHLEFLSDRFSTMAHDEVGVDAGDLAVLGMMFGDNLLTPVIDKSLKVDDRFIFSVGKLTTAGGSLPVSWGVFGHIFPASETKMKKAMEENEYLKDYVDFLK